MEGQVSQAMEVGGGGGGGRCKYGSWVCRRYSRGQPGGLSQLRAEGFAREGSSERPLSTRLAEGRPPVAQEGEGLWMWPCCFAWHILLLLLQVSVL